jgi:hypothetical protein
MTEAVAYYMSNLGRGEHDNVFKENKEGKPFKTIQSERLVCITKREYDSLIATIDDLQAQLFNARRTR